MAAEKIKKSETYSEHFAEFAGFGASSTSQDFVNIHFLSNRLGPTLLSANASSEPGKTDIQVGASNELCHECTIFMSLNQLKVLKSTIEQAISQIEGNP